MNINSYDNLSSKNKAKNIDSSNNIKNAASIMFVKKNISKSWWVYFDEANTLAQDIHNNQQLKYGGKKRFFVFLKANE